jgi:L-ascorbate metabolism protein UlaG (beta-lactamase superfamily)
MIALSGLSRSPSTRAWVGSMLITHVGHSCLLVESGDVRVLLDPGAYTHGFEELTGLDAVLVTHAHPDHCDAERLPTLLEANPGALLIAEPETAAELRRVGLESSPLHPGESTEVGSLTVTATGGAHDGDLHAVIHEEVPRIGNVGMVLSAEGEPTLFHPGDSYAVVPRDVDVLALPLSAPWASLSDTVAFLRAVAPRSAVPIHDALLSTAGREIYLGGVTRLAPEGTQVRDLAGTGPVAFD